MAPTAVEWFTDASPKLHTVIASSGHGQATPSFLATRNGERDADSPRKVRCDGRGLRNDVQVVAAEHLVPPACDRFLGGRHHPKKHVAQRVSAADLGGAGEEEPTGAVVQQRGIGGPQRRRHRRIALMPRRADGVVALALRPQPAGGQIEMAAAELGVEHRQALAHGQRGTVAQHILVRALPADPLSAEMVVVKYSSIGSANRGLLG